MGRDAGFLAQNSAIASGAEAAIIPEDKTDVDQLEQFISRGFRKSKNSSIVLVSESKKDGGAMHYAERIRTEYPQYDVRVNILGHLQRGGTMSDIVFDPDYCRNISLDIRYVLFTIDKLAGADHLLKEMVFVK